MRVKCVRAATLQVEHTDDHAPMTDRHGQFGHAVDQRMYEIRHAACIGHQHHFPGRRHTTDYTTAERAPVTDMDVRRQIRGQRLAAELPVLMVDRNQGHEFPAEVFCQCIGNPLLHRQRRQILERNARDLGNDGEPGGAVHWA